MHFTMNHIGIGEQESSLYTHTNRPPKIAFGNECMCMVNADVSVTSNILPQTVEQQL